MATRVSAIVGCPSGGRYVAQTIESLMRQTHGELEVVVLVTQPPDTAEPRLAGLLAGHPRLRRVAVRSPGPGAGWNAGIRSSCGGYVVCLDEGDTFEPRYLETAAARLDAEEGCAFVTAWTLRRAPTGETCDVGIVVDHLETALCVPWSVSRACVFRRTLWESCGGFDESLDTLEDYDFWLHVLERGARGTVIPEPLIHESCRKDSRQRLSLGGGAYLDAMARILSHRRLPAPGDVAALLLNPLHSFGLSKPEPLRTEHRMLVERRDGVAAELAALTEESRFLRERLHEAGRDGIDWGDLRRLSPVSADWGYERGKPIDRHYIEQFLELHASDVRGRVLEVQENDYTLRFGGSAVEQSDVVDVDVTNTRATLVADLRHAASIPSATYDCFIFTQTLHVIDDMRAVLAECVRILKPGGVLLVTLPCASRVCLEYGQDGDFWRVTEAGARRLFADFFPSAGLEIHSHGNVLATTAFLYGLACHELAAEEFDTTDHYHPLLVSVRAVKPLVAMSTDGVRNPPPVAEDAEEGLILLYHRVAERTADVHRLCVPPATFRAQMEHLRAHYQPMDLAALAAAARSGRLPRRAVAVTFDDGYVDSLLNASPILCELGIPATFFVTGAGWDAPHEFWWDTLERLLLFPHPVPERLELTLDGEPLVLPTATAAQRQAAHTAIYDLIVRRPLEQRDRIVEALRSWNDHALPPRPGERPLTAEEIRLLASRPGHAIGAHTTHHLALPAQPVAVQENEVADHKRQLEGLVDRAVVAFAYPFGDYSPETVAVVRRACFQVAVTCEERPVRRGDEAMRLPRVEIKAWPVETFARRLRPQLQERSARDAGR